MVTKRLFSIVFIFHLSISIGQISFQNISFNEALEKAKKEKKLVFLDCMTSWCGPCKKADREIFSDTTVGDYFNTHYISLKLDMEKGEGPLLAKKYQVNCYPTLLEIDSLGEIVNYFNVISFNSGQFLNSVIEKQKTQNQFKTLKEKFENNSISNSELYFLIKQLGVGCQDYNPHLELFGQKIKFDNSELNHAYELFQTNNATLNNSLSRYIFTYYDTIAQKYGSPDLYSRFFNLFSYEIYLISEIQDEKLRNQAFTEYLGNCSKFPIELRETVKNDFKIVYLIKTNNTEELNITLQHCLHLLSEDALFLFCTSILEHENEINLLNIAYNISKELAKKYPTISFIQLNHLEYQCYFKELSIAEFEEKSLFIKTIAERDLTGFELLESITFNLEQLREKYFKN